MRHCSHTSSENKSNLQCYIRKLEDDLERGIDPCFDPNRLLSFFREMLKEKETWEPQIQAAEEFERDC